MEYAVSFMWITLEIVCLYYTCQAFLSRRLSNRAYIFLVTATIILIFLSRTAIQSLLAESIIPLALSLGICLIFSFIGFSGPWYAHFVIVAIYYLALGLVDTAMIYGTSMILGITAEALVWKKWLYTVVVASGKCVLLFLSWILYSLYGNKKSHPIRKTKLALSAVFPLLSILMLYTVFITYKNEIDLSWNAVIFSFVLGVSNVALIYLFGSMERTSRAERELAILNQSMNLQTENIKNLEKSYRDQRTATHEFKHQLQVISDLLERGNALSAKEYVDQLQIEQSTRIFAANTNHPIVDAILNQKYHLAIEEQIDIRYKVNDLSKLELEANAIVVVLSNLLDNAIEATLRLPSDQRIIECTILLNENFFVSIRNTAPPVEIKNGEIATNKEPKEEHGFGLPGVRRILQQLGGEYAFDYSEPWFQFVAEVPLYKQ